MIPKRVILAPTGSGKSYYVNQCPEQRVDYDWIISRTIGWPTDIQHNEEERLRTFSRNGKFFVDLPVKRVVYGMFADFESHFSKPTEVAIVIIDQKLHRQRLTQRSRWPTIAEWDSIIVNQITRLRKLAEDHQIPIFDDFDRVDRFKLVKM